MYKKQRVTKNLGKNRSNEKEEIYKYIEDILGYKTKKCSKSKENSGKYNFYHVGPSEIPIRNFNLLKCGFDGDGNFYQEKPGIPLQSYCIDCERKYRRGRLNKWGSKYKNMSDDEVYENYKVVYGPIATCSRCKEDKIPEDFSISRKMDKGLHNVCKQCSKSYSEAVGNRWIIYSPSGRNSISITKDDIEKYGYVSLSKDHVWPLSKGGSDNNENIEIIPKTKNSSKSNTIPDFIESVEQINKKQITDRYWPILKKAKEEKWDIRKFEIQISKAVSKLIEHKMKMNDEELKNFFESEKRKNNKKINIDRAARKFREYIKNSSSIRNLDI